MTGILGEFRLDGKVAVLTGASAGLGAGFAVALAQAGSDVVITSRRADMLDQVAEQVRGTGRRALPVTADITDPAECARVAQAAADEFGRIDILVNNAGLGTAVPATRESPEEFRRVIDINLMAAYWMAQACIAHMPPGSSIVNVSSTLGLIPSRFPQAAYSASKAALLGLTRDLSAQWAGRRGVRVNALAPGYAATEMSAQVRPDLLEDFIASRSPLARLGEHREIQAALVFLAAPASSYITGTTLAVDGGMSAH